MPRMAAPLLSSSSLAIGFSQTSKRHGALHDCRVANSFYGSTATSQNRWRIRVPFLEAAERSAVVINAVAAWYGLDPLAVGMFNSRCRARLLAGEIALYSRRASQNHKHEPPGRAGRVHCITAQINDRQSEAESPPKAAAFKPFGLSALRPPCSQPDGRESAMHRDDVPLTHVDIGSTAPGYRLGAPPHNPEVYCFAGRSPPSRVRHSLGARLTGLRPVLTAHDGDASVHQPIVSE